MNNISYDEYKYITPNEIHQYPGWTVLEIIKVDDMISNQVQEKDQYGNFIYNTKHTVISSARMLIGRKNEDALPTLNAALQVEKQMVYQLTNQIEYSNRKMEELSKKLEEKKKEYEDESARMERFRNIDKEVTRILRVSKEKMEEDLGKIRMAIGDIKFKEIVGPIS